MSRRYGSEEERHLRDRVDASPDDAEARKALAALLARRGETAGAIVQLLAGARILVRARRFASALALCFEAIHLNPDNTEAQDLLAQLYARVPAPDDPSRVVRPADETLSIIDLGESERVDELDSGSLTIIEDDEDALADLMAEEGDMDDVERELDPTVSSPPPLPDEVVRRSSGSHEAADAATTEIPTAHEVVEARRSDDWGATPESLPALDPEIEAFASGEVPALRVPSQEPAPDSSVGRRRDVPGSGALPAVPARSFPSPRMGRISPASQIVRSDSLARLQLFGGLEHETLARALEQSNLLSVREGGTIVTASDTLESLFVILSGVVRMRLDLEESGRIELGRLEAGDFFGEQELIAGVPSQQTAIAGTTTELLELPVNVVEELRESSEVFDRYLLGAARRRTIDRLFMTSTVFRCFRNRERSTLRESMSLVSADARDVVLLEGEWSPGIYVVLRGRLRATRRDRGGEQREVCEFVPGGYFGLTSCARDLASEIMVVAQEPVELYLIPVETVGMLLSRNSAARDAAGREARRRAEAFSLDGRSS